MNVSLVLDSVRVVLSLSDSASLGVEAILIVVMKLAIVCSCNGTSSLSIALYFDIYKPKTISAYRQRRKSSLASNARSIMYNQALLSIFRRTSFSKPSIRFIF
jgi:hypothetical protein